MNTLKLGCQGKIEDLPLLKQYTDIIQMMPLDPKSYQCGYSTIEKAYRVIKEHMQDLSKVVIHMPYWINLFPDNEDTDTHVSCINTFMEFSHKYKFKYLITHLGNMRLGGPEPKECIALAKTLLADAFKISKNTDVILLFENQAKNGLDCHSLIKLVSCINCSLGHKSAGFCFDIEHAYASGEPLDQFETFMNVADIIHFNPIPKSVKYGGYKDSHNISIQESVGIAPDQYVQWALKYRYKNKIMEQRPEKFVESLLWLKERL